MNDAFRIPYGLAALFARLQLQPRGIVHLGAHEGQELAGYLLGGFQKIMLFEPSSDAFRSLLRRVGEVEAILSRVFEMKFIERVPQIRCIPAAALECQAPKVPFYEMGYRKGSSTEPIDPRGWRSVWPTSLGHGLFASAGNLFRRHWLTRVRNTEVQSLTVDQAVERSGWDLTEITCLRMNIQGAEYRALLGASRVLHHVAVVSFDFADAPRYGGAGRRPLADYDSLLATYGLTRVATIRGREDWLVTYVRSSEVQRASLERTDR